MNSQTLRFPLLAAALLAAFSSVSLSAAIVTWTGNGDSNSSGNWVTGANWSALPTSADTATLGDVGSGTRTITINSGETANAKVLSFTQTTAVGSNILTIASGGTLTGLSGSQTWGSDTNVGTTTVNVGGLVDFAGGSGTFVIKTALNFTDSGAVFRSTSTSVSPVFTFSRAVTVNVGSGGTAQISTPTNTGLTLTSTFDATSTLTITSGTLEFFSAKTFGSAGAVTTNLNGSTTISSGAALRLAVTPGTTLGSAGVALTNSGTMTQSGTVTSSPRGGGGTSTIANSGTWAISGTGVIEKLAAAGSTSAVTIFTNTGTFRGNGTADSIDYNHLPAAGGDIDFQNSGVIAAGNGSSGSGLTSVGTFTLVDFKVTNNTGSALTFDIGGTTSGQFDVIALQSSSMTLTNATLAIKLVNGFAPSSSFSVDILTSDVPSSVSGSFVGLTVNGSANSDYSFAYNSTTGIGTLSYTASGIPEPSTYAIAAGVISLGMVSLRRRRGKNVSV